MDDIHIRKMEETDIERICQIERENFSDPWTYEGFLDAFHLNQTCLVVAEVTDLKTGKKELAGYSCAYIVYTEADITNVSVAREHQNKGIANKMLTELMGRLKDDGVDEYTLEVRVSNEPAIHLYEKFGFVSEGIRPGFYDHPREDAMIMWKR